MTSPKMTVTNGAVGEESNDGSSSPSSPFMRALCHKCGTAKNSPLEPCSSCRAFPQNDDEVARSFMLSDAFMPQDRLQDAARMLKTGQGIAMPPDVRDNILNALRRAQSGGARPPNPAPATKGRDTVIFAVIAACAVLFFLYLLPYPHYQWAAFRNNPASFESFLKRFPESEYTPQATEQLRKLRDDDVWLQTQTQGTIAAHRNYVRTYPDGKHLQEAKEWIVSNADKVWATLSQSRSETEIHKFIRDYRDTPKAAVAEARIQELHNDWTWVREQDNLLYYQKFAAAFPKHPQINWIEKRIVDLEVKAIAAGKYGEMPPAQALSRGGDTVDIEVENKTSYELTVRYSGPGSKKLVIPTGATRSTKLIPGNYQVAASVSAANVTNYYGSDTMQGGKYSSSFYIETTSGFGSSRYSLPSLPGRRGR